MASGFLRVRGNEVVDGDGKTVILKGFALGGWMNMENFITGYPGHECQHRAAMRQVLGEQDYEYFFDQWLTYHFQEDDAKFLKSTGLNCLRIPFNYRHFEDDMNPRVLKTAGFKHLDRVIGLCAAHGIYTILDLHAAPGGQNNDWHSDNPSSYAHFWDHKDFQDRTVWLWTELASHYKGNPWIAGFNPMNEPSDALHYRLPAFYERVEQAVRKADPDHILFLDGNTFSMEWQHFDKILPNCVYSMHDYSSYGFPSSEPYAGAPHQKERIEASFMRKTEFMRKHNVPIWNGEFGPVYADAELDTDSDAINKRRYAVLEEQLRLYEKHEISWTMWVYKDIGIQGLVYTRPDSPWNTRIKPFLEKKRALQLDGWAARPAPQMESLIHQLAALIEEANPRAKETYPQIWPVRRHLQRRVLHDFLSQSFSNEFAELFSGLGKPELDELAKSFRFSQCAQREGLVQTIKQRS